ncbi:MAG: type I-B CRISPR-associated protein Cas7/Csh2 [Paludibacteraceae bacterium]
MENSIEKSEILFLYEGKFTVPNGDPFTGEQRYDDETKHILVSDVRIKRFVRDYFIDKYQNTGDYKVFVYNDKSQIVEGSKESGASARMQTLWGDNKPKDKKLYEKAALKLLQTCIDVRLFGGISTEKDAAVNITGPVQFALLNPSLNKADLRIHQNTSVFSSSADKSRGAIGTTTVVPYALNQIHGWVNPYSAVNSALKKEDIDELFSAIWNSINNSNTRSKSNQSSVLLVQIVYNNANDKLYGTDKLISINSDKEEEQIREMGDYTFDFSKLAMAASSDKVKEIRYYTEISAISDAITALKQPKIKPVKLL